MASFFRNIRQNLLMENKSMKYIKYAFGEIFLVVVGILIALQINNWNVVRIEKNNEQKILRDLKVEFEENLKDANRVRNGNMGIFRAMVRIQENFVTQNYNSKEMDSLMYYVFDWFDYTPKPGASNNLINSGNLNLIQNTELRNLLTIWSGVESELEDDELLAINYSQNIIIPFLAKNYPVSNLEQYDATIDDYYTEGRLERRNSLPESIPYAVEKLLTDPEFQSHVSAKKMYAGHNFSEGFLVVKTCETILELIDKELRKAN